jgi:acetoin utilization protein AcuB
MFVRDVMTTNVVTVPSSTSIYDARNIMKAHKFRRLPVVDKGKLVGLVTDHSLDQVSPSKATSLSVWELNYLLAKTTLKDVMIKNIVSVTPDMTVEEAVVIAQTNKVGSLPVVEDGKVVGIVTTNDFFYRIINPILGVGKPGVRLTIHKCCRSMDLEKVFGTIKKHNLPIVTMFLDKLPDATEGDLLIHLDTEDASAVTGELKASGYEVEVRKR